LLKTQTLAVPYHRANLLEAIKQYESLVKAGNWHTFPRNILIYPKDTNKHVISLQENLLLTGDLQLDYTSDDSVYSDEIRKAVVNFQLRHGLKPDGVLGPRTAAALNVPISTRLRQLQLNLTRWDTSLANSTQPYVVINLPDYSLKVVDSNRTVLDMRVVIGKPDLPTMEINSKVDMVVFHPNWYIPTSIAVDEIVPILQRNPGYLDSRNMRLERKTGIGWLKTNPWRVNWHEVNRSNFNYRIIQLSGPQNELGKVKFPFPNSIPQYMHDTPSKSLFEYPTRAFSHGCIRLEKPMEFAYYLLQEGSGFDMDKINRLWERNKPNHYIRVKNPPPLYIIYLTAWADENKQVHFREDLYGYDNIPRLSKE
jgi:L,D-transpeptidase YcbB